jgi:hypothetical protein
MSLHGKIACFFDLEDQSYSDKSDNVSVVGVRKTCSAVDAKEF